jgi:hypothetical protein
MLPALERRRLLPLPWELPLLVVEVDSVAELALLLWVMLSALVWLVALLFLPQLSVLELELLALCVCGSIWRWLAISSPSTSSG